MAYVHKSVNEMSKQYLTNERRYNYTTPKSFLELVSNHFLTAAICSYIRSYIYHPYFSWL
jgi:hypothetical protein